MSETVDDLSIEYKEDDKVLTKELNKVVLSKGAWTTILYRYQDWDPKIDDYGPEKYSIRRYQKKSGYYQQKSKFNISSQQQAQKIIEALSSWIEA